MSRIVLAFLAAAGSAAPAGGPTAEQALARYHDLTGSAPSAAAMRRRCAAGNVRAGEIVVCASDPARERLPFPDAHLRAAPGDRILHPDEAPRADGRTDVAPCGANCPDAAHAPQTFHYILSWLKGEDPR